MEFLEGSVKPLSEKLTAKSRRAKIKLSLKIVDGPTRLLQFASR